MNCDKCRLQKRCEGVDCYYDYHPEPINNDIDYDLIDKTNQCESCQDQLCNCDDAKLIEIQLKGEC